MCYFITVAVSERAAEDLNASIPRGLAISPHRNPSITRHIPEDFTAFVLTRGMCSCELFCSGVASESPERRADRLRKKYTKLKWSDAKIERAIRSSRGSHRPHPVREGYDEQVRQLIAALAEIHDDVKIVAHFYDGDVDTEKVNVKHGSTITPSAFRDGNCEAREDVMVTVSTRCGS